MLLRRSLPAAVAVAVTATLTAALSACSSGGGPVAADVDLAPGTSVFAAPPPTPDCSRIDMTVLGALSAVGAPAPRRLLTYADPGRPKQTWAACAGLASSETDPAAGAAGTTGTAGAAGAAGGATPAAEVLKPTREGASGPAAWLVRYATSASASRDQPLVNPYAGDRGHRTLVREATLGDAPARVELSVEADTHVTLVLVSVFDPRTGRDAAECAIGAVPGPAVDAAVAWCLRAVAGQLVRRPAPSPSRVTGTAEASPGAARTAQAPRSVDPSRPATAPGRSGPVSSATPSG